MNNSDDLNHCRNAPSGIFLFSTSMLAAQKEEIKRMSQCPFGHFSFLNYDLVLRALAHMRDEVAMPLRAFFFSQRPGHQGESMKTDTCRNAPSGIFLFSTS